ncbi:MAG: TssQ family T6SS-associated lipoprotein [Burkholderiaceae bacterium]|nr:TssQ family T6SS-associated lipoprotein [Burkholderiaceae bacterium]
MKSLPALVIPLFLATGCIVAPISLGSSNPPPERLPQKVARLTLERAQKAYDEGDYSRTLATLQSSTSVFASADPATRQEALKLEAFTYCVSRQVSECEAQFVKLLTAFPEFTLSVAERNHPVWGPAFEKARLARR